MLEEYFSDVAIIEYVCNERIKLAGQLHDRLCINRLAGTEIEAPPSHPYYQLLPPRRQWSQYRSRMRNTGVNPDLAALKRAVRRLRHQQPQPPWAQRLDNYITAIRERVFGVHPIVFAAPEVVFKPKKEGSHEYRALCKFSPDDNLIQCLFSRYLCAEFDSAFSNCSYAFRARRDGVMPTHHQAFDEIFQLKHSAPAKDLYVSECDIRGFFDTIDHSVALTAFRAAAAKRDLHHRAEPIFRAFLNCFSFPQNVLTETTPLLKQRDKEGYFKWPADALKEHHTNPFSARIGVPQGSAISGIVANLVLDRADKAVEAVQGRFPNQIHYWRYCDDMILVCENKAACTAAFEAYLAALKPIKLPYHLPQETVVYGKQHWDHKTKSPYLWSGKKWFGCVPWIQFVGYQIRYDGLVRPRKESVGKEAAKMVKVVSRLKHGLTNISHPVQSSRNQVRMSLKSKLAAQGVGRIQGGERGPRPMCWASGFKGLHLKPFVPGSLRNLDRVRSKQIRRFDAAQIPYGNGRTTSHVRRRNPVGYGFSYEGQFVNSGGHDLIENPWRPRTRRDLFRTLLYHSCPTFLSWWWKLFCR